jgi:hypothetical protein
MQTTSPRNLKEEIAEYKKKSEEKKNQNKKPKEEFGGATLFTDENIQDIIAGESKVSDANFKMEVSEKIRIKGFGRGPGKIYKNHNTSKERSGPVRTYTAQERLDFQMKDPERARRFFKHNGKGESMDYQEYKEKVKIMEFEPKNAEDAALVFQVSSCLHSLSGNLVSGKSFMPIFNKTFPKTKIPGNRAVREKKIRNAFSTVCSRLILYDMVKRLSKDEIPEDFKKDGSTRVVFALSQEVGEFSQERLNCLQNEVQNLSGRYTSKPPDKKTKSAAGALKSDSKSAKKAKPSGDTKGKSTKHISPKILARTALASKTAREIIPSLVPGQTLMIKIESCGEIAINVKYEYEL